MISLKALFETIDRFENDRRFVAKTIHLNKYDFLFRPERIGYVIYMNQNFTVNGKIIFLQPAGLSFITDILAHDEFLIKNIIK